MASMRQFKVTASNLWRAFLCLGSAILPKAEATSEAAERGIAIHKYLLDCNRVGQDLAIANVPEKYRPACGLIDLTRLPVDPTKYAAEVALAFDARTGKARELHRKGDRYYSQATATEICGTADVVALVDDEVVKVIDYKSGYKTLPAPEANWQFRFLGLAAARAYDRTHALVEMIRIGSDGFPYPIRGELDLWALAETAEELRELYANGTRAAA